uniref:Neuronal acetylcholine receptor subunit alpha-7 n=1 Tax=Macrostomum lignano TaxID=282301 RepID=A0A1I8JFT5_9PLAT
TWVDYHFKWDPAEYGQVTKINIDPKRVWKPDILLYNSADEKFDATYPTNVVIEHTGLMTYIPPGMFRSTCKIDITWFPFDTQVCKLKFGSWTYDGGTVDLRFKCSNESLVTIEQRLNDPLNCSVNGAGDTSTYIPSGEWNLEEIPGIRHSNLYDCCTYPFIDLEFFMKIRRRKLYYIFNLIAPCSFLACLALLSFIIPPDAGEKVSFGVTILLSLTVFLMMVAEAMPPTSDAVPVIGMYFACTMIMCSLSVVFTVIVLNYHHRDAESHPVPNWQQQQAATHQCSTRGDLAAVLNELRIITKKISDDIADNEISSEWKFAARVVDRLCLIMFSCFTIVSTCAILFSAPDVFKG